jgi:succinate-acetate transporter protein
MLAFVLGLVLLFLYVCLNSKDKIGLVDVMGVIGLLCIAIHFYVLRSVTYCLCK